MCKCRQSKASPRFYYGHRIYRVGGICVFLYLFGAYAGRRSCVIYITQRNNKTKPFNAFALVEFDKKGE